MVHLLLQEGSDSSRSASGFAVAPATAYRRRGTRNRSSNKQQQQHGKKKKNILLESIAVCLLIVAIFPFIVGAQFRLTFQTFQMLWHITDSDLETSSSRSNINVNNRNEDNNIKDNIYLRVPPPSITGGISKKTGTATDTADSTASAAVASATKLPKTLVIYFPQYHRDSLNDKNWGDNFTDWDSLRESPLANKMKQPIPRPLFAAGTKSLNTTAANNDQEPPLGYYDLSDTEPRRKQGILAKKYGIDGFIYHHYWFYDNFNNDNDTNINDNKNNPSNEHSNNNKKPPILAKPLENMLKDGHPDLAFMLNWCAIRWVNVWMGKAIFQTIPTSKNRAIVLQEQYFNATKNMIHDHYLWLKPFFEHPNYIRIDNEPAFLLYYYDPRAVPILEQLRQFAIDDGFDGLHFIVGRSSHPESLYDISHINKDQRTVLDRKVQSLDSVDPTKTKSNTKSIFDRKMNNNNAGTKNGSSTNLTAEGAVQAPKRAASQQTWDYNPFNQTMTYPYPLEYLTRPFQVPAWCSSSSSRKDSTSTTTTKLQHHHNHPEIIGVMTAFDNTPRRKFKEAVVWNGGETISGESPDDAIARFRTSYASTLYYQKCCVGGTNGIDNIKESKIKPRSKLMLNSLDDNDRFVAVNSWNEWAEGMAIEPSDVYGYRWLETIKEVQEEIRKRPCAAITIPNE